MDLFQLTYPDGYGGYKTVGGYDWLFSRGVFIDAEEEEALPQREICASKGEGTQLYLQVWQLTPFGIFLSSGHILSLWGVVTTNHFGSLDDKINKCQGPNICPNCGAEEIISYEVLEDFDMMYPEELLHGPHQFRCERCEEGIMQGRRIWSTS